MACTQSVPVGLPIAIVHSAVVCTWPPGKVPVVEHLSVSSALREQLCSVQDEEQIFLG